MEKKIEEIFRQEVGRYIFKRRREKCWSQQKLASLLNLSRQSISEKEINGILDYLELFRVIEALGCESPDEKIKELRLITFNKCCFE